MIWGSDAYSYHALLGVAARLEAEHAKKQKRGRAKRTTEK